MPPPPFPLHLAPCPLPLAPCPLPLARGIASPFGSSVSGLPYFFNVTAGYVGIYGNADPLDSTQVRL